MLYSALDSHAEEVKRRLTVCETVGTERTEFRKLVVLAEDLLDVTTRGAIGKLDLEPQSTLNDADLSRSYHHVSKLRLDVEATELGHDEHVTVVAHESFAVHRGVAHVHVDSEAVFGHWVARTGDGLETLGEVDFLVVGRKGEGRPSDLGGGDRNSRVQVLEVRLGLRFPPFFKRPLS